MATQRITIAKIAGVGGEVVSKRMEAWSAARITKNPREFSPEQWPVEARRQADDFAERLRTNGLSPPVCYFAEWADPWSMGCLFTHWLTPPDGKLPYIYSNNYEIYSYDISDGGRLADSLAAAGPQQYPEEDWFVSRLTEAVKAWERMAPNAVLVALRHVIDGSVLDEEMEAALKRRPQWLL